MEVDRMVYRFLALADSYLRFSCKFFAKMWTKPLSQTCTIFCSLKSYYHSITCSTAFHFGCINSQLFRSFCIIFWAPAPYSWILQLMHTESSPEALSQSAGSFSIHLYLCSFHILRCEDTIGKKKKMLQVNIRQNSTICKDTVPWSL